MELGPYQLQILVSLILILAGALVALICDFLKGNNEQLRELTIELKVRREEERKRGRFLMPRTAAATAGSGPAALPVQSEHLGKSLAALTEKRRMPSSSALAAMQKGEQLAGSGRRPRTAESRPGRESVAAIVESVMTRAPRKSPELQAEQPAGAVPSNAGPVDVHNWSALLSKTRAPMRAESPAPAPTATVPERAAESSRTLPAGFYDSVVLSDLIQNRQRVTGLVVSISVNATRQAEGSLPATVRELVQSLVGPRDFAAQSAAEEFILILPEERDASAQRRLSQIAQQLWDFQLRSLGTYSILFSWGGIEVQNELIEEAIISASERMQETKRGRKILTMGPRGERSPLKQAV